MRLLVFLALIAGGHCTPVHSYSRDLETLVSDVRDLEGGHSDATGPKLWKFLNTLSQTAFGNLDPDCAVLIFSGLPATKCVKKLGDDFNKDPKATLPFLRNILAFGFSQEALGQIGIQYPRSRTKKAEPDADNLQLEEEVELGEVEFEDFDDYLRQLGLAAVGEGLHDTTIVNEEANIAVSPMALQQEFRAINTVLLALPSKHQDLRASDGANHDFFWLMHMIAFGARAATPPVSVHAVSSTFQHAKRQDKFNSLVARSAREESLNWNDRGQAVWAKRETLHDVLVGVNLVGDAGGDEAHPALGIIQLDPNHLARVFPHFVTEAPIVDVVLADHDRLVGNWMRDYGPYWVNNVQNHECKVRALRYSRDDVIVPGKYLKARGTALHNDHNAQSLIAMIQRVFAQVPIVGEGGNFVYGGPDRCLMSTLVIWDRLGDAREGLIADVSNAIETGGDILAALMALRHAQDVARRQIILLMYQHFGCTRTIFVPGIIGDGTQHVDMFLYFSKVGTLIHGEYQDDQDPINARLLRNTITSLQELEGFRNDELTYAPIPMPPNCAAANWDCHAGVDLDTEAGVNAAINQPRVVRSYVNAVQLNNVVVLPIYGGDRAKADEVLVARDDLDPQYKGFRADSDDDDPLVVKAIRTWLEHGNGVSYVVTSTSEANIAEGGAAHCMTRTKPAACVPNLARV